jgi:AcrR family transcriptional regulator
MAEPNRTPLPSSVVLAWRSSRERRPGRRPGLTLEKIVDAGIAIAARGGIGAVSLAKVAESLGCATTSLYRHVRSKDDLVVLMRDAAAAPPADLAGPDPDHWRSALADIAWQIFDVYRRHPWVLEVPPIGPPTTPNELMWGELMLQALSRTRLGPGDQLRTVTLINGYVREQARLAADPVISAQGPAAGEHEYFQLLRAVMTPDRYPMFCRLFSSDAIGRSISYTDEDFRFGLDRILVGLAELDE